MVEFKIKGIKKATAKGGTYYYDRITGKRITAEFGTAEFMIEVEALRAGINTDEAKKSPITKNGTLGALIHAWRASPEFTGLAVRTRKDYNRIVDFLKPLTPLPISQFDQAYILKIRDKANAAHKWRFANYVVAVLSSAFSWGTLRNYAASNPALKVPKIKRPKDLAQQNRAWTDDELETALKTLPDHLKVAVALSAFTGIREGDMVNLPLSADRGDEIAWRQSKTGDLVTLPIHKKLRPFLNMAKYLPKRKGTTMVIGLRGRPFTQDGFRAVFFKAMKELESEKKVGIGLTYHGLRHTVGTKLAELGASDVEIQDTLGHRTATQAQRYRRDASKKASAGAAIHLLSKNKKRRD